MTGSTVLMVTLIAISGISMPMFCWLIARRKGRKGRTWLMGSLIATWFVPACGGLVSLIVAAVMPKVGEPITGENDKKVLYGAIVSLLAGIAGWAMLFPSIMTIVNAMK